MTEREAVAAAMHELAADASACRWCGSSTTTASRVPTGGGRCPSCSTGAASSSSTGSSSRRVSTAGPTPGASVARPSPTASPSSASCTLATSPSPWHRRHPRRTCAAMPSAWAGPTCPGTRSAPSASRADFGVDEWFGLNVFLRDGDDVYRTYFLQHGPMVQTHRQHLEPVLPHALRRAVRRRGRARGLAAGAVVVLVPPSRRVRRTSALRLAELPHRLSSRASARGCRRSPHE